MKIGMKNLRKLKYAWHVVKNMKLVDGKGRELGVHVMQDFAQMSVNEKPDTENVQCQTKCLTQKKHILLDLLMEKARLCYR